MLTVNEVFLSIQGEGTRAGRPCVFVRLTGCPLRCAWCDTAYAFHEGARHEEESLLAKLRAFPVRLLCLTGGEPLAQPAAFPFVARLVDEGWEVVVVSNLERLRPTDEAKFVIDGRADYEWSRDLVRERDLASRCTVLFSPVHGVLDPGALGRWILDDHLPVRLQVQLHKYLWPGVPRGV